MRKQFTVDTKDIVWQNARIVTMNPIHNHEVIYDHDLIIRDDKIVAIIPSQKYSANQIVMDAKNGLILPGFIDCHTHLVFGGNRAKEWEMRLNGVPYTEIAKNGGGINSTVNATRTTTFDDLYELSIRRLIALIKDGVTTVEIKSGYGLSLEHERKQLEVAKKLAENYPIEIAKTLLSAHAVPPEFKDNSDSYVNEICTNILPTLWEEKCFEAVDVFCESVGFTLEQTRKVFTAAQKLGIPVKGHTEQLSNLGGSALVASFNGLSVDHIEYLDENGIRAIKESGTVATILPLAFYFLKETKHPPIQLLRDYGVPIAISTDFNPGTAPFASIRLAMNMASVHFGLTPKEVLEGVTINAAKALGRENLVGQIKENFTANFNVWDVEHPVEIFYELGHNPLIYRVFNGKITKDHIV